MPRYQGVSTRQRPPATPRRLITGKPPDIELLRHRLGFVETNPVEDADLEAHIGTVRIANVPKHRWIMSSCSTQSNRDRARSEAGDPGIRLTHRESTGGVMSHWPSRVEPPTGSQGADIVGLSGTRQQVAAVETAYRIHTRRHKGGDCEYSVDHTWNIQIMDPARRFVGLLSELMPPERLAERLTRLVK